MDYVEIFSPVIKQTSIRVLLSIVAEFNLELDQMDFQTAFLHGDLNEMFYMSQPLELKTRYVFSNELYMDQSKHLDNGI